MDLISPGTRGNLQLHPSTHWCREVMVLSSTRAGLLFAKATEKTWYRRWQEKLVTEPKYPYPVLMLDISSSGSWSSWKWQWPDQHLNRELICWYKTFLRRVGSGQNGILLPCSLQALHRPSALLDRCLRYVASFVMVAQDFCIISRQADRITLMSQGNNFKIDFFFSILLQVFLQMEKGRKQQNKGQERQISQKWDPEK